MCEIDLFWYLNCVFMLNLIELFSYLTVCKQKTILILNWIVWNFYQNDLIRKRLIGRKTKQPNNQLSSQTITISFGLIPIGKLRTSLFDQLCVKCACVCVCVCVCVCLYVYACMCMYRYLCVCMCVHVCVCVFYVLLPFCKDSIGIK